MGQQPTYRRRGFLGTAAKATVGVVGVGIAGTASAADRYTTVEIEPESVDKAAKYFFKVTGRIDRGGAAEGNDTVVNRDSTSYAYGKVSKPYVDTFNYSGSIIDFNVTSRYEDGDDRICTVNFKNGGFQGTNRDRVRVTCDGGGNGSLHYAFSVTGDVDKTGSTDGNDLVDGAYGEGYVGNCCKDVYRTNGEIDYLYFEGGATRGFVRHY